MRVCVVREMSERLVGGVGQLEVRGNAAAGGREGWGWGGPVQTAVRGEGAKSALV